MSEAAQTPHRRSLNRFSWLGGAHDYERATCSVWAGMQRGLSRDWIGKGKAKSVPGGGGRLGFWEWDGFVRI